MKKLRKHAEMTIRAAGTGLAKKMAHKVILLEKAYRYMMAGNLMLVEMINGQQRFTSSGVCPWGFSKEKHRETIEKLSQKRARVMGKADALYREAEAV